MKRVDFLMQGLEINEVQAAILSEQIKDIPNIKLKDFLVFRAKYIAPKMSKELITKAALYDYRRIQYEARLKSGERIFEGIEQMRDFIETYYKGRDIGYGLGHFYEYVVIGVDEDGNLINKYTQNEHGSFRKLNSTDSADVYQDIFENQHKIGEIKHIQYTEPKALPKVPQAKYIDAQVLEKARKIAQSPKNP